MKIVAITMMRLYEPTRQEWRDALDQRWAALLQACGLLPLYLPNQADVAEVLLRQANPAGVIFSGGGDCSAISGQQDARDLTEARALGWALEQAKPVYGVCRGMQAVLGHFGAVPLPVSGHVATRHPVSLNHSAVNVNSFHHYGYRDIPPGFSATGLTADGFIEAVSDAQRDVHLVMWHPEREERAMAHDIQMIKHIFGAE